jgi:putrescine aminotransferase
MRQDLAEAQRKSAYVLDLISKKSLSDDERRRVIEESVRYWTDHVNEGFLRFRKSVSTDYTAVEWADEGAVFRDIQGREFIDILGGYGIYVVGHRHPTVMKAVRDPLRTYLAHLVALITPGDLQFAFLTNSGTESVEGCLKMATLATGRHHFIGTVGAFHGKSMGSLGGTSKAVFREPFLPLLKWTHVPWGDIDVLAKMMKTFDFTGDRVAAVVLEPIQGEGGIHVAPPGYLAAARELCDRYGSMLVFDEIQSGMGRSGKMFACEHDGVAPDLMALGKGFGGGVMPIGAVAGTAKTWEKYIENPFLHTTTFGGIPVACAAAIATIHVLLAEDLPRQAGEKGVYLLGKFAELGARYPNLLRIWRGRGLMLGLEFADDHLGYAVSKNLFARQILIGGTYINSRTLRVEPPLTISYPQLDRFLAALDESLAAVYREHRL